MKENDVLKTSHYLVKASTEKSLENLVQIILTIPSLYFQHCHTNPIGPSSLCTPRLKVLSTQDLQGPAVEPMLSL